MGGAGRGASTLDKQSWLYCVMQQKNIHAVDIQQLLGISRQTLYQILRNPGRYLTGDDMLKIAIRIDEPLDKVVAWCVGGAAHYRKHGKAWFESDEKDKTAPNE